MTRANPQRWWWLFGAVNGALIVALGAYGAHAVNDSRQATLLQTAVQYHMFHTLGLFAVSLVATAYPRSPLWPWVSGLMSIGIVLFCGSLYIAALSDYQGLRELTPFGGSAFIGAWVIFAIALLRSR